LCSALPGSTTCCDYQILSEKQLQKQNFWVRRRQRKKKKGIRPERTKCPFPFIQKVPCAGTAVENFAMTNLSVNMSVVKGYYLFLDETNAPILKSPDGTRKKLNDSALSRWLLRTTVPSLKASPKGLEWFRKWLPDKLPEIPGLKTQLKMHQILALNRIRISNCALWLDMGTGKTLATIAYTLLAWRYGRRVSLIVCPPTCAISWEDQFKEHLHPSFSYEYLFAHGTARKHIAKYRTELPTSPLYILTSYGNLDSVLNHVEPLPIGTIVFDESQHIKNPSTNRTRASFRAASMFPKARIVLLSGTPSSNDPLGFFSQYEMLGKEKSGHSNFVSFRSHYCDTVLFMRCRTPEGRIVHVPCEPDDAPSHWLKRHTEPSSGVSYHTKGYAFSDSSGPGRIRILNKYPMKKGFKNLDGLKRITAMNAYCLRKEQVLDDLPSKTFVRRSVKMSNEQRKLYKEAAEGLKSLVQKKKFDFSKESPFFKLHQIANGFLLHEDLPIYLDKQPKLDELLCILEEAGEQSMLVWAPFPAQIEKCSQSLIEKGHAAETIHGSVAVEERHARVRRFQNKKTRILVCNPEVAGMGLNLTVSAIAVFLSNWHRADIRNQAIDRIHRMGQKKPVSVIDLVAEGTVEAKILADLKRKTRTENTILGFDDLMGKEKE